MDSEHRHDLKKNELVEVLRHIPDFIRENTITIVIAAFIIAAFLLVPHIKKKRLQARATEYADITSLIRTVAERKGMILQGQQQGQNVENLLLFSANSLEIAAGETQNPLLAASALIKRAEALRADLHYKAADVEGDIVISQIKLAQKAYEKAIKKAQGNNVMVAMAQYGLGLCAEETGRFDIAEKIYREIAANPDFEGTVFPLQAQFRLDGIEDNKEKFVFAKAPEPTQSDIPVFQTSPVQPEPREDLSGTETPETVPAVETKPE